MLTRSFRTFLIGGFVFSKDYEHGQLRDFPRRLRTAETQLDFSIFHCTLAKQNFWMFSVNEKNVSVAKP